MQILPSRLLNPTSTRKSRVALLLHRLKVRQEQMDSANYWLFTGEQSAVKPSYGKEWNRDYNPMPYPEAKPEDVDLYLDTGIAALYGWEGGEEHVWQLAGWNLVRTGGENRKRRKMT